MKMEYNKNFGKVLLGTAVILIGSLLLLDNLDITSFPWTHYLLSWKSIMIFVGLVLLTNQKNIGAGIILISLGTIFWLPEMLDHQISLKQVFWPSLLIIIGVVVIFKTRHQRGHKDHALASSNEGEVTIIKDDEDK
jgi:hypothetical protein